MDGWTAEQHLDRLRAAVMERYPRVRVIRSMSGGRLGEDRYEFAPRNSVYVQAPVTLNGKPRRPNGSWRYRRSPIGAWTVCIRRRSVFRAICQMASAAGHQPQT
jgi:hypothetical protein